MEMATKGSFTQPKLSLMRVMCSMMMSGDPDDTPCFDETNTKGMKTTEGSALNPRRVCLTE